MKFFEGLEKFSNEEEEKEDTNMGKNNHINIRIAVSVLRRCGSNRCRRLQVSRNVKLSYMLLGVYTSNFTSSLNSI